MVKIIDYKLRQSNDGKQFFALILQGGVEIIKSKESGGIYATVRKASLATTFDELTCQTLIGIELPGSIEKVSCEPYQYTIQQTGEVVTLNYRFEYVDQEQVDFTKIYKASSNGVHS
ncbi:MAG: hypothetical protein ACTHMD_10950 [Flavisolibacter sp.]